MCSPLRSKWKSTMKRAWCIRWPSGHIQSRLCCVEKVIATAVLLCHFVAAASGMPWLIHPCSGRWRVVICQSHSAMAINTLNTQTRLENSSTLQTRRLSGYISHQISYMRIYALIILFLFLFFLMRPLTPSISTPGAARETPEDWRGFFFLNPIIHHSIVETSLSFGFQLPAELSRISIAEDKTVFEFWVWSTTSISLNKWRHLGGNQPLGPTWVLSTPKIYIYIYIIIYIIFIYILIAGV